MDNFLFFLSEDTHSIKMRVLGYFLIKGQKKKQNFTASTVQYYSNSTA